MFVTKDQERKALQQIKKIVEDLGEDSYIAAAFDGAFELAEENIDNDWASSCRWYMDHYAKAIKQNQGIREEFDSKERHLVSVIKGQEAELVQKEHELSGQELKIEVLERELFDARAVNEKQDQDFVQLKNVIELKNLEITRLKAKLYDLMTIDD